jgi:hypothetical protein
MLTRSKVILLIFGVFCAGIITAQNYGTAYAYSTEDIADFNATTVSYYQNLTITAIVPPAKFGEIGIKSTPENAIDGQAIQIQITVKYPLNKNGYSSEDFAQTPHHQSLSFIEAGHMRDVMSNKSAQCFTQDNFANGTIIREPLDISETVGKRIAGIKYSGMVMSAAQAAICFCYLNGLTYENVTEESSVVVLGAGGTYPSLVAVEESAPIAPDFDVADGSIDPANETMSMMSTASTQAPAENRVYMPLQFTPTYNIPVNLQANATGGMQTEDFGLGFLITVVVCLLIMIIVEWKVYDFMGVGAKAYADGYRAGWIDGVKHQASDDNATIWAAFWNGTITFQQAVALTAGIFANMDDNLKNIPTPPTNPYDQQFDSWKFIWAIIEFLMPVIIVVVVAFIAWALICNLIGSSKRKLSEAVSSKSEKATGGRKITIEASTIYTNAMGGILAVI